MQKIMNKLKELEIFDDDWTKKINFLGIAIKHTPKQEMGIILLKSHGNIYGIKINSNKVDMGFDSYIENTECEINKYNSISDLEKIFKDNFFDAFLPLSNIPKEIIISEKDGWYDFKFIEVLLDMKPYEFCSSIINLKPDLMEHLSDIEEFVNKIYQEFPLEEIIKYNKTATIPIKISNEEER